ncbi:hypothetical protein [Streptomyces sp. HC307]
MTESWIDHFPEPAADAVHLDVVMDDDLGVIVRAVTSDGREATAAESW